MNSVMQQVPIGELPPEVRTYFETLSRCLPGRAWQILGEDGNPICQVLALYPSRAGSQCQSVDVDILETDFPIPAPDILSPDFEDLEDLR